MRIDRRQFIGGAVMLGAGALFVPAWLGAKPAASYPVSYSDAEWKKRLTPGQYAVLRQEATERAGSSPLNKEHRAGIFQCAGCRHPLFHSRTKFESGTGWPSFYQPMPRAVGTTTDYKIGYARTEVHCAQCGGHLGHVFDDGPNPTGKRYCMNGVAMTFVPAKKA